MVLTRETMCSKRDDSWITAYIGVGANLRPKDNIIQAISLLKKHVRVEAVSTFYRTKALRRPGQPDYWNGVIRIETDFPPEFLKHNILRPIEERLGRVRGDDDYAARPIDLDVVLFGDVVRRDDDMTLPDPDIRERSFIAIPLWEVAPELHMPDTGEGIADLAQHMPRDEMWADDEFTKELRRRSLHE